MNDGSVHKNNGETFHRGDESDSASDFGKLM